MATIRLYDTLTLWSAYDTEEGWYECGVRGVISTPDYYGFVDTLHNVVIQYPLTRGLFDQRIGFPLPPHLRMHAFQEFIPWMVGQGLRAIAVVPSDLEAAQRLLQEMPQALASLTSLSFRILPDMHTGRSWLRGQ